MRYIPHAGRKAGKEAIMIDVTTLPVNKQFTRRLIKPDTWIINPYDPNLAAPHPHVVIGEKYALVIDATWTTLPLRQYIEQYVTDKPLLLACSHAHHDHTNANWMFNDVPIYMSAPAWDELRARRELDDVTGKWFGHQKGDYVPHILKAGDVIDLGGREIEVLPYVGCHSPGSLLYLDRKYGVLFTGDEIECGQMLVSGRPGTKTCVELLRENIANLLAGWGDKIDTICPPHNGSPFHAKFLEYLVENCDRIMSGIEGDNDVGSLSYLYNPHEDRSPEQVKAVIDNPKLKRSEWMGTSIVYNTDRIFKSQVE